MRRRDRALAAALLAAPLSACGLLFGEAERPLEGAPVRRGPLRITVVERGNLAAADPIVLKSEVEGQTTILSLVEEGTQVEAGDVLCELDATALRDRRVGQRIALQNANAAYVQAQQTYEIQKSENQSLIANAERLVYFARAELDKYLEGDWPRQRKDAEDEILLAEEELERARDQLAWSRRLEEKGFLTRTELEADRLVFSRAEVKVEQAKRQLVLLEKYDFPMEERRLEADVEESERELERARLEAAARLVDREAALETSRATLELETEKLEKLDAQIAKATIRAPVAGMVVYSRDGGGRFGRDDPIAEGTSVRERQEILTIPSAEGMVAEVSLHESVFEQVRKGQTCTIEVDALPGRVFRGDVRFKALLPDSNSWWANPDLRLYRTDVRILDPTPDMRPGMSCAIEILVEEIPDALHVPAQSVFLHRGETICFVVGGTGGAAPRAVETGASSYQWTEIRDGLSEGELVALAPPPGFALESGGESDGEPGAPPDGRPDVEARADEAGLERPAAGGRPEGAEGERWREEGGGPEERPVREDAGRPGEARR